MTKSLSTVLSLLLLLPVQLSAGTAVSPLAVADSCQMVHLDVECLPDLTLPAPATMPCLSTGG